MVLEDVSTRLAVMCYILTTQEPGSLWVPREVPPPLQMTVTFSTHNYWSWSDDRSESLLHRTYSHILKDAQEHKLPLM